MSIRGRNVCKNKNSDKIYNASAREIAEKELRKEKKEKKVVGTLLSLAIISGVLLFIMLFSQSAFTGFTFYADKIDAKGGTLTEIVISGDMATDYWAGIYGLAFRLPDFYDTIYSNFEAGNLARQDLFFSCLQKDVVGGNDVFVSPAPQINFDSLRPATPEEVDEYTGCYEKLDCAVNTLTDTIDVYIGHRLIENVPASFSQRSDGTLTQYDFGALHDGDNVIFVTHIGPMEPAINNIDVINYQMLLPIPKGSEVRYYFFTDPNDVCPQGGGTGDSIVATVSGSVLNEDGDFLEGSAVTIAGVTSYSNSEGYYNLSFETIPGEYNLFSKLDGYDDYFSVINFSLDNHTIEKNIIMNKLTPGIGDVFNVRVSGQVKDVVGSPISDAHVFFGKGYSKTDALGNFEILTLLTPGNYSLVSVKENYNNFNEFIYVGEENKSFERDIVMEVINDNAFEEGPFTEEPQEGKYDEEVVEKGSDYWVSTKEIIKEVRQGTFVKDAIAIYNLKKNQMDLKFELSPELKNIVKLDKLTASVPSETAFELNTIIYGMAEIGEYTGKITITGDLEKEIPIKIKIVEKNFPVEVMLMDLEVFDEVVEPGKELKYKLSLQNLLRDQEYQVNLDVKLKDLIGNETYYEDNHVADLKTSSTLINQIPIPENFTAGDYLLEVNARYLNFYSTTSIPVDIYRPVYMYSFFGVPLWVMFVMISSLSFCGMGFYAYKRYRDRNKRYSTKLDYSTLPKPGPRVVRMGYIAETKKPAYYEIDKLTVHSIVAGATGMGKSISAQVLIEECLMKDVAVMVFDPTAQWSGMLRKCTDKKMFKFYSKFGMKPKDARAFKGNVRMIKDYRQKLDINKFVAPGQIQIFSMNKLTPSQIDIFVANTIKQVFRSDPKEYPQLKVLLVFDEVHRLLPKFGGSGSGFLQIERACREFRKWGLGVMLISQVLNDFAGQIKANINTELQARTLEEGDLERIRANYGEEFLKSLVKAEVGNIMFQNAAYNRGMPYFINFRPILHSVKRLTDEELEKYNEYNDKVDEIEFQVDKLNEEKVDTFDLKMELKLIKDKIMSGSFSVVEIYLEGLVPRVKKEWEKLGKEAPKYEIEFVDEDAMKKEEERAKKEKEKEDAEENVKKVEEKVLGEGEDSENSEEEDSSKETKEEEKDKE